MSFESDKPFNDFQHFARGIRRSGDFTIRESDLLERHGAAMMELYNGEREPRDEAERVFLQQIRSHEVLTDQNARIFRKYLTVIKPRHLHRLCSVGNDEDLNAPGFSGSGEDSSLD